jgi:hypothetical protein
MSISPIAPILWFVGIVLLLLGGLAGVVLLIRATVAKSDVVPGGSTLWGLLIVGLFFGLIVLSIASHTR